jgi:hypothetical protein
MRAIVDHVAFLALSGDDVVNEDAALNQLEHVAATLQELAPDERRAFVGFVGELAEKTGDDRRREFLQALPEHLGLLND